MRPLLSVLVLLFLTATSGCSQDQDLSPTDLDTRAGEARIVVSPAALDVGRCEAGDARASPITVTNNGTAALFLDRLELVQAGSFGILDAALAVPAGASREIWVEFAPMGFESIEGQLVIHSNDPTAPEVAVALTGLGDAGQVTLEPMFVEVVADGLGELSQISVINTGSQPLQVNQVVLDASSDELILAGMGTLPAVVQPEQELLLSVAYDPVDATADRAELSIFCDDPAQPVAVASLFASPDLEEVIEETTLGEIGQIDILWAIDFGTNMGDRCDDLAAVVAPYTVDLQAAGVDFQMAVMTVYDPIFLGLPPYVAADDPMAAVTVASIIAETPHPQGTEMGLAHVVTAVSPPATDPGGRHEGFLRPDARLQVNYYENEDDLSPGPVAQYVDELVALKGGAENLVINCIGLYTSHRHCQAAQMTGGRVAEIETADLSAELAGYAAQAEHDRVAVLLEQRPLQETLAVELDGVPVFEGWSYDTQWNAIEFDEDHWPPAGTRVTVRFRVLR